MSNTSKVEANFDFNKILNDSLGVFFKDAVRIALTSPSQSIFFLRTLRWQKKAAKKRSDWEHQGVHVPPHSGNQRHKPM